MANPYAAIKRVEDIVEPKTTYNILNPHSKEPSGTKGTNKPRLGKPNMVGRVAPHRRGADYESKEDKRKHAADKSDDKKDTKNKKEKTHGKNRRKKKNMSTEAIKFIIDNHGKQISGKVEEFPDKPALAEAANKFMFTCMKGWESKDGKITNAKSGLELSSSDWTLNEDTTLSLRNIGRLNEDWLYELMNKARTISEAVDYEAYVDQDDLAESLNSASGIIKKLDDARVQEYIIDAAKNDNVDPKVLREVMKEIGINWRLLGCSIEGSTVYIDLMVKYSEDGTQKGVVKKDLSIEVKPGLKVMERDADRQPEVSEPEEPAIEPETEPDIDDEDDMAELTESIRSMLRWTN